MKAHKISVLILAAGSSSRMSGIKQLLPWGTTTLIEHTLQLAMGSTANKVYVVLGAHYDRINQIIEQQKVTVVHNHNWEVGMGGSIAAGVRSILDHEDPDGILIMLCDQPLIDLDHLNSLIREFSTNDYAIVGTSYGDKIGVPAVFSSSLFGALMQLKGDEGARAVIVQDIGNQKGIDPEGKHADIDTAEDYSRISGKKAD